MRPLPISHLALGALIVFFAGIAGELIRLQTPEAPRAPKCDMKKRHRCAPSRSQAATDWPVGAPTPPTRLLVKFRDPSFLRTLVEGTAGRVPGEHVDLENLLDRIGTGGFEESYPELGGLALFSLDAGADAQRALAVLQRNPKVEYAELDALWHLDDIPDDPSFEQQWGLENVGQSVNGHPAGARGVDIEAPAAWKIGRGSGEVVVGIIDSGVDYTHEDLNANMWANPGEIPGNGVDDDDNGIVDDVHGMNAVNDSGDPMDDAGHGTHVAGTIGAVGDNGRGVAGVNWTTRIMALKFLSRFGGGSTSDAIKCIDYAILMRERGVNLRVINCSWGSTARSKALEDAIGRAADAGILFVCAAGNEGSDSDRRPHFPSSYELDGVLSVAALAPDGKLASFSNFGSKSVDIAAPGFDVLSTLPGNQYGFASGTSMAAPHVTGVIALVLASDTKLPLAKLRTRLLSAAFVAPGLEKTVTGGRLSGAGALGG
jgi:subtilisin family serine protease